MPGNDFDKTNVNGSTFDTFGCDVVRENPETPDRLEPDVRLTRKVFGSGKVEMPDGEKIRVWGFADPDGADEKPFPSATIRVRQGQIVHSTIETSKGSHTIHHHGIEPSTFNDGVGHVSFEVNGQYDYQWLASQAGTYFYHCHKNTTLHFEMGMYGMLIVDPPDGPGTAFEGGPAYDKEAIWVADEIDPRWRELNQDAGLCGEDAGLNVMDPKYFLISGVAHPDTRRDPRVRIDCKVGETILIRLLNASYGILSTRFMGLDAEVVSVEGRSLGTEDRPWTQPFNLPSRKWFELNTGQRYDLILKPTAPGNYGVAMRFLDWITGEVRGDGAGIAQTVIRVR